MVTRAFPDVDQNVWPVDVLFEAERQKALTRFRHSFMAECYHEFCFFIHLYGFKLDWSQCYFMSAINRRQVVAGSACG